MKAPFFTWDTFLESSSRFKWLEFIYKGELYAIDTDQLYPEISYSFIDEIDSYSLETTQSININILLDVVPETDTSDVLRIKVNNFKPK